MLDDAGRVVGDRGGRPQSEDMAVALTCSCSMHIVHKEVSLKMHSINTRNGVRPELGYCIGKWE